MNTRSTKVLVPLVAAALLLAGVVVLVRSIPPLDSGTPPALAERRGVNVPAPDFSLLDQYGRYHDLYGRRASKAVVLYTHGLDCNVVSVTLHKLEALRTAYE